MCQKLIRRHTSTRNPRSYHIDKSFFTSVILNLATYVTVILLIGSVVFEKLNAPFAEEVVLIN